MDKIKEKLEKLRVESEANNARAETAEAEVRELKAALAKTETETQGLQNKISLLTSDLERAEKRASEASEQLSCAGCANTQFKDHSHPVPGCARSRHHERKAKILENEKAELEKKHDELHATHTKLKSDFETTMAEMEAL
ncbi:hypothetical protein BC830DRAFT_197006 [Chytriomyces sp. MP71]|nr:hypothetical protein BC830DRAFT_197006 [Chytriomyces sp. MP71]